MHFINLYNFCTIAKTTGKLKTGAYLRIDGRTKGKLRQAKGYRSKNVVAVALEDSKNGECLVQIVSASIPIIDSTIQSLPVINEYINK